MASSSSSVIQSHPLPARPVSLEDLIGRTATPPPLPLALNDLPVYVWTIDEAKQVPTKPNPTLRTFVSHHARYVPHLHWSYDALTCVDTLHLNWHTRAWLPPLITQSTGHLAFTLLGPPQNSRFLAPLNYSRYSMPIELIPTASTTEWGRHRLDPTVVDKWRKLTHYMIEFCGDLRRFNQGDIRLTTLVWQRLPNFDDLAKRTWPDTEDGKRQASDAAYMAWRCMLPLIARLSFTIACHPGREEIPPRWYSDLRSLGHAASHLDDLQASEIVDFSGKVPRVGALLDITSERQNYVVYLQCGVPAWFELTPDAQNLLARSRWPVPSDAAIVRAHTSPSEPIPGFPKLPSPAPRLKFEYVTVEAPGKPTRVTVRRCDTGTSDAEKIDDRASALAAWLNPVVHETWGTAQDTVSPSDGIGAPFEGHTDRVLVKGTRLERGVVVPEDYPVLPRYNRQKGGETPQEYFQRRKEHRQMVLASRSETPEQVQSREAREALFADRVQQRSPPGKASRLACFQWKQQNGYWVRTRVDRRDWPDLFGRYVFVERFYDPFGGGDNQGTLDFWHDPDGPTYLSPDEVHDLEDEELEGRNFMDDYYDPTDTIMIDDTPRERQDPNANDDDDEINRWLVYTWNYPGMGFDRIARIRAGYISEGTPPDLEPNDKRREEALDVFGSRRLPMSVKRDVADFVQSIQSDSGFWRGDVLEVRPEMFPRWDIFTDAMSPAHRPATLLAFPEGTFQGEVGYEICFPGVADPGTDVWSIVVHDPVTAVQCLRLSYEGDRDYLATELLHTGIQFRTYLMAPRGHRVSTRKTESVGLGYRHPDWKIATVGQDGGVEFRGCVASWYGALNLVLSRSSKITAALKHGGIVWRLTMEVLLVRGTPLEDVQNDILNGPSVNALQPGADIQCFKKPDGTVWYDDTLTEHELDVIAGVYRLYTTVKALDEQARLWSWWPRHNTWHSERWNGRVWTRYDEDWFLRRKEKLELHAQGPSCTSDWKKNLRVTSRARRWWQRLSGVCQGWADNEAAEAAIAQAQAQAEMAG